MGEGPTFLKLVDYACKERSDAAVGAATSSKIESSYLALRIDKRNSFTLFLHRMYDI